MITALKRGRPQETVPAGTTWTITQSGQWEVPATGQYQVELHGGGGGGGGGFITSSCSSFGGGGGGGSGEIFTVRLTKGQKVNVGIGVGGSAGFGSPQFGWAGSDGSSGEKTLFGELQVNGGGGGYVQSSYAGGAASGSLATDGSGGGLNYSGPGGVGNKNNPSQTYGNGGLGGNGAYAGSAGNPGAAIITFLGA